MRLRGIEDFQLPHRRIIPILATTGASAFSRLSALLSQIIAGVYLTEAQVGTFAAAIGLIGFTSIGRSGGAMLVFPTVTPEEYDRYAGRMFWWGSAFVTVAALLTISSAFVPGLPERVTGGVLGSTAELDSATRELRLLLLLLGVRQLLAPIAMLGRMKMTVFRRFKELAALDSANAILRTALTWFLAAEGAGALALGAAFASQVVIEAVFCGIAGRVRRSDFRWSGGSIRETLVMMRWPLVITALISLNTQSNFLIVRWAVPISVLGIYYFAFQLANQPTMFLTSSLQNVLAPLMADQRGDSSREREGFRRVFAGAMLFVPITTIATAAFFPSLEALIWEGKWAAANGALYFLCAGATYATAAGLLVGPLLGLRRFRSVALFEAAKAIGVIGGALLGCALVRESTSLGLDSYSPSAIVGAATGAAMSVISVAQLAWIARVYRFGTDEVVRQLTFGPAVAILTAVAAQSIGHSTIESLQLGPGRLSSAVELATVSATYLVLVVLILRFTAESTVRETIEVLPAAVRTRLLSVLRLT